MPGAESKNYEIYIDGVEVPDDHFLSFTVDRDMNQPDMAVVVLSNQNNAYTDKKIGAAIEIKLGDPAETIYKGELVGLEPHFQGGGKTTVALRAMNKFHRLIRRRRSLTFAQKTDQQIINQVAADNGLQLSWKSDVQTVHQHVYQHNLSDMEFVRMRCARIGMNVWCVDTTLHCEFPDLQKDAALALTLDPGQDGIGLKAFKPKMSSHAIVKTVTVKGWNPETKELITGQFQSKPSKLGTTTASDASEDFGATETFTVDQPIWSREEATDIAKGRHSDMSMGFITGQAETLGSAKFDLGMIVKIAVDNKSPFNGKYYILGISHRHASGSKDGATTNLRLARDSQGQ